MARGFIIFSLSSLVALAAYQWTSISSFPPSVENRSHRYTIEFLSQSFFKVGLVLDSLNLIPLEKVLRASYDIGSLIMDSSGHAADDITLQFTSIQNIPVAIHRPRNSAQKQLPAVVYYHGGGWVFGSPKTHLPFTKWMSETTDVIVFSVDYGLSPDVDYETQIQQCVDVAEAILDPSNPYGVDSGRVFVGGDSAGGNLAASLSMILSKKFKLKGALLLSPSLQMANITLPSNRLYRHYFHAPLEFYITKRAQVPYDSSIQYAIHESLEIPSELLQKWNKEYLNVLDIPGYEMPTKGANEVRVSGTVDLKKYEHSLSKLSKLATDPRAFPLIAEDEMLKSLPPTFVQACELDFIRDDALLYAHRLRKLGIDVVLSYLKDAQHVEPIINFFMPPPVSKPAQQGLDDIAKFINQRK